MAMYWLINRTTILTEIKSASRHIPVKTVKSADFPVMVITVKPLVNAETARLVMLLVSLTNLQLSVDEN